MNIYTITHYGPDGEPHTTYPIKGEMEMAAYNNGLMTKSHPLFELTQTAVFAQDNYDGLMEFEELLHYQRCPETGAYIDKEKELDKLDAVIMEACRIRTQAHNDLVEAINNQ